MKIPISLNLTSTPSLIRENGGECQQHRVTNFKTELNKKLKHNLGGNQETVRNRRPANMAS